MILKREAMNNLVSEDDLLTWDWVIEQINHSLHYWLSTTRSNGYPHVVPIAAIWYDDALYFSVSKQSVKGRNISNQPNVALHLESSTNVFILEGQTQLANDDVVQAHITTPYTRRYNFTPPTGQSNQWYKLAPQRVLGWLLQDSYHTATRWVATHKLTGSS
ncbi:MAG: pyridoxamine 5'-phosphate oxidase family protein [Chloroflexota bacterium]